MRLSRIAITIAAAAALVPSTAHASGSAVIQDCIDNEGNLSKTYSAKDYRDALAHLPADADQYSDCRDAIRAAARGAGIGSTGSGGSGGGGGGTASGGSDSGWGRRGGPGRRCGRRSAEHRDPGRAQCDRKAIADGDTPLVLDGRPIDPASMGSAALTNIGDLPAPLIFVLGLLSAGVIAAAARWSISHVGKRRATS